MVSTNGSLNCVGIKAKAGVESFREGCPGAQGLTAKARLILGRSNGSGNGKQFYRRQLAGGARGSATRALDQGRARSIRLLQLLTRRDLEGT